MVALACTSAAHAQQAPAHREQAAKYTFVAFGDTRSDPVSHAACIARIVQIHPEFVVQSGDQVAEGANGAEWAEFDRIEKPLADAHIPVYPARGNHDIGGYFIKHVTQPYDSGDGYYYAFTKHGTRWMVLDTEGEHEIGSEQMVWAEGVLKKAAAAHLPVVAYFHEPPYSVGVHGPNADIQQTFHALLKKYHVPLVFCGHDHLYYRTVRDGIQYVITGGGGAPLYPEAHKEVFQPGDYFESVHHVIRCDVTGNHLHAAAMTPDGQIFDQFDTTLTPVHL
jgi:3',5'-cyclic AMP phosphodiesterase CpdA